MTHTDNVLNAWARVDQLDHDLLAPIETEQQYRHALAFFEELWDRIPDGESSASGTLFQLLSERIAAHEQQAYPVPVAPPHRILRFLMEQRNLTQQQLARHVGIDQGNISKLLNGRREFTTGHIKVLSDFFHVNPLVFLA